MLHFEEREGEEARDRLLLRHGLPLSREGELLHDIQEILIYEESIDKGDRQRAQQVDVVTGLETVDSIAAVDAFVAIALSISDRWGPLRELLARQLAKRAFRKDVIVLRRSTSSDFCRAVEAAISWALRAPTGGQELLEECASLVQNISSRERSRVALSKTSVAELLSNAVVERSYESSALGTLLKAIGSLCTEPISIIERFNINPDVDFGVESWPAEHEEEIESARETDRGNVKEAREGYGDNDPSFIPPPSLAAVGAGIVDVSLNATKSTNGDVVLGGVSALYGLASYPSSRMEILNSGAVSSLFSAMEAFPLRQDIVSCALDALTLLAKDDPSLPDADGGEGSTRTLSFCADALRRHKSKRIVVEAASLCVAEVCSGQGDILKDEALAVVEPLLEALGLLEGPKSGGTPILGGSFHRTGLIPDPPGASAGGGAMAGRAGGAGDPLGHASITALCAGLHAVSCVGSLSDDCSSSLRSGGALTVLANAVDSVCSHNAAFVASSNAAVVAVLFGRAIACLEGGKAKGKVKEAVAKRLFSLIRGINAINAPILQAVSILLGSEKTNKALWRMDLLKFAGEPIINKIFPLPAMVAAMDLFAKLVESSPAFCASVAKELGMDILRSLELYPSNSLLEASGWKLVVLLAADHNSRASLLSFGAREVVRLVSGTMTKSALAILPLCRSIPALSWAKGLRETEDTFQSILDFAVCLSFSSDLANVSALALFAIAKADPTNAAKASVKNIELLRSLAMVSLRINDNNDRSTLLALCGTLELLLSQEHVAAAFTGTAESLDQLSSPTSKKQKQPPIEIDSPSSSASAPSSPLSSRSFPVGPVRGLCSWLREAFYGRSLEGCRAVVSVFEALSRWEKGQQMLCFAEADGFASKADESILLGATSASFDGPCRPVMLLLNLLERFDSLTSTESDEKVLLISLAISVLSRCLQTSSIRKLFGSEDEGPRRLVEVMLALSASSAAAVSSSAPSTPSKKGKGSGGKGLSATTSLGSPSEGVGSPRKLAKIPLPPHAVSLLLFALCRLPKQRERVANAGGMELAAKVLKACVVGRLEDAADPLLTAMASMAKSSAVAKGTLHSHAPLLISAAEVLVSCRAK